MKKKILNTTTGKKPKVIPVQPNPVPKTKTRKIIDSAMEVKRDDKKGQ